MLSPETQDERLRVVFVCYGSFNCNGGGHIAGFANALAGRGCDVAVVAAGDPAGAWDFGKPHFQCFTHEACSLAIPRQLRDFVANTGAIIHAWTPRETVRKITARLDAGAHLPYCVHLEDNEKFILNSELEALNERWSDMSGPEVDRIVPSHLSHPLHSKNFVERADGVTAITGSLSRFIPSASPTLILPPGVDTGTFVSDLPSSERDRERARIGIGPETQLIFYHGGMHASNRRDLHSLYTSILILQRRGHDVHLLRCGQDDSRASDASTDFVRDRHVTEMGWVDKQKLIGLSKLADIFVQPGGINDFNQYRLPSKIPEFLALGKPVILPRTNIGLLLQDGVEALLLDKGDEFEIADKVESLLNDPSMARRIGHGGRAFAVREMSWGDRAAELEAFYRRLLQRRSPSALGPRLAGARDGIS